MKGRTLSQISTFSKIGTNQNRLTKSIELLQLQKENYEKQKKEIEIYAHDKILKQMKLNNLLKKVKLR